MITTTRVILATCEDRIDQYFIKNSSTMEIDICGKAHDQITLGNLLEGIKADVILLNRSIPGPLSIDVLLEEFRKSGIRTVLMLTGDEDPAILNKAIRLQVYDFLIGSYGSEDFYRVLKTPNSLEKAMQYILNFYPHLEFATTAEKIKQTEVFSISTPFNESKNILPSMSSEIPNLGITQPHNSISFPFGIQQQQRKSISVGIYSAKGGVGKSNIAVNTTAILNNISGQSVVVDTDLHQGILGSILKVKTNFSITDWINFPNSIDEKMITQFLGKHHSGMYCLPSPLDYIGQPLSEEVIQKVYENLSKCFSSIVFDTDGKFTRSNLYILKKVDLVFYIMSYDSTALERHKKTIQRLIEFGIDQEKIRVILNDPHQNASKQDKDFVVQKMFPIQVGSLSYSRDLQKASEHGDPIVFYKQKAMFTKELTQILSKWLHLSTHSEKIKVPKKWWFRFGKRKEEVGI